MKGRTRRVAGELVIRPEGNRAPACWARGRTCPACSRPWPRRRAAGAEEAVVALAPEHGLDPEPGLLDLRRVAEHVGAVAESLQPVRHLFPAVLALALGVEPGVVLLLHELAQLAKMTMETRGLELQLLAQPPAGANCTHWQLHQRAGQERPTIRRVMAIRRARSFGPVDHPEIRLRRDHGKPENAQHQGSAPQCRDHRWAPEEGRVRGSAWKPWLASGRPRFGHQFSRPWRRASMDRARSCLTPRPRLSALPR